MARRDVTRDPKLADLLVRRAKALFMIGGALLFAVLVLWSETVGDAPDSALGLVRPEQLVGGGVPSIEPGLYEDRRVTLGSNVPSSATQESAPGALTSGRPVRVLSALTGAPLPGALVTWVPAIVPGRRSALAEGQLLAQFLQGRDPEVDLRDCGQTWVADERGRLFLPAQEGLAMGRHKELWLLRELRGDPSAEAVLALEPETTLRVRVIDYLGVPVRNVDVVLVQRDGVWPTALLTRRTKGVLKQATFLHFGAVARAMESGAFDSVDRLSTFFLAAVIHAPEPVFVPLDLRTPPVGSLDLQLPPTGSLVVRASSSDGKHFATDKLWSYLDETGVDRDTFPDRFVNAQLGPHVLGGDGLTRYEQVGLGMQFSVDIRFEGGAERHQEIIHGPRSAGEEVTVAVDVPDSEAVLGIRVFDEHSSPLRKGEALDIQLLLTLVDGSSHGRVLKSVSVGPGGQLRVHLDAYQSSVVGGTCQVRLDQPGGGRRAQLETRHELVAGLNDLGDVALLRAGLLASGVVTDTRGQPVMGARLTVRGTWPLEGGSYRVGELISCSGSRTDPTGAFELHGFSSEDRLRLEVHHPDYPLARIDDVAFGARGVDITVRASGGIAGSLLLAEGVSSEGLEIAVASGDPEGQWRREPRQDGSFSFSALPTGEFVVSVLSRHEVEPLAVYEKVIVTEGHLNRDPRLAGIDMSHVRVLDFVICDPAGAPVPEGNIWVASPAMSFDESDEHFFRNGHFQVLTLQPTVNVRIQAELFQMAEASGVVRGMRFEMVPWKKVRMALDSSSGVPPPGWILEIFVGPNEQYGCEPAGQGGTPEQGFSEWRIESPGRWSAAILLSKIGSKTSWEVPEPISFEVLDLPGEQRIEVHLPQAAIDALVNATGEPDESGQ